MRRGVKVPAVKLALEWRGGRAVGVRRVVKEPRERRYWLAQAMSSLNCLKMVTMWSIVVVVVGGGGFWMTTYRKTTHLERDSSTMPLKISNKVISNFALTKNYSNHRGESVVQLVRMRFRFGIVRFVFKSFRIAWVSVQFDVKLSNLIWKVSSSTWKWLWTTTYYFLLGECSSMSTKLILIWNWFSLTSKTSSMLKAGRLSNLIRKMSSFTWKWYNDDESGMVG